MAVNDVNVINVSVNDDGIEFQVFSSQEKRKGIAVAHSYFVEFSGEVYGSRAKDLVEEISDLAEDIHFGWKRAPKEEA